MHDETAGDWLGAGRRKRSVRLGAPRGKAERVAIPSEGVPKIGGAYSRRPIVSEKEHFCIVMFLAFV